MSQFKNDLDKIKTLKEFFDVCEKHYDCEGTRVGEIVRKQLIKNVDKLIAISGAKKRTVNETPKKSILDLLK